MRTILACSLATVLPLCAQVQLSTASGAGPRCPVVALDAPTVAWLAMAGGTRELFATDLGSGSPVRLTNGADVRIGWGTLDAWSPIGISDDGNRITWWNAQGVHVTDRQAATDTIVATSSLLPMPRLDGPGNRVVFQAPVNGQLEVFVVNATGSPAPAAITQNSGPGRRLPHLRGDTVVFQKLVGSHMELFAHDLVTGTTSPALTQNSGGGNRHGRLTPDADAILFEAVSGGMLEARRLVLATGIATPVGSGGSGVRLAHGDGDDQVLLQSQANAPEVALFDPASTSLTTGSRGGHRLPGLDRHGRVLVWQNESQGVLEVFALQRCRPVDVSFYGTHGQPSQGTLSSFHDDFRCRKAMGLHTPLPAGTLALFAIGPQQAVPLGGAPGNFLWIQPIDYVWTPVDAQGDAVLWINLSPAFVQAHVQGQFAVFDPAANPLGIVTSQGFDLLFR
jgi:hypothetical protein